MSIDINSLIGRIITADCFDILPRLDGKCVDLVLADPPYGINYGRGGGFNASHGWGSWREKVCWDVDRPPAEFFTAIQRVGKNQIVWGGNYFTDYLPPSMGWLVWDKGQRDFSLADGELAWCSHKKALRIFSYSRAAAMVDGKCHPTQKPIALYSWILNHFTKPGNLVLDLMCGSGTTALACHATGRRFICIEREPEYAGMACARLRNAQAQVSLFDKEINQDGVVQERLSV